MLLFLGCLHQRCRCIVWRWKNSAEARLGGMTEQSLLKQISSLRQNQCSHSYAQCFALCFITNPIEPLILGNLPITTQLSLPVRAFLKSIRPHLPTSSNWSLWWIQDPSIQWEEGGVGLPTLPMNNSSSVCYRTLPMSPKVDWTVFLYLYRNIYIKSELNQTSGVRADLSSDLCTGCLLAYRWHTHRAD